MSSSGGELDDGHGPQSHISPNHSQHVKRQPDAEHIDSGDFIDESAVKALSAAGSAELQYSEQLRTSDDEGCGNFSLSTPGPSQKSVASASVPAEAMIIGGDVTLVMQMAIEEDVVAELEQFVRLARLQLNQQAENYFDQVLQPHISWFPVFAEYAEFIVGLQKGATRLRALLDTVQLDDFTQEELDLYRLLQALLYSETSANPTSGVKPFKAPTRLLQDDCGMNQPMTPVEAQIIETFLIFSDRLDPSFDANRRAAAADGYFKLTLRENRSWSAWRVLPIVTTFFEPFSLLITQCNMHEEEDEAVLVRVTVAVTLAAKSLAEVIDTLRSGQEKQTAMAPWDARATFLRLHDDQIRNREWLEDLHETEPAGELCELWQMCSESLVQASSFLGVSEKHGTGTTKSASLHRQKGTSIPMAQVASAPPDESSGSKLERLESTA